jgi:hypothetical protein
MSGFWIFVGVFVVAAAIVWLIYDLLRRSDMSVGTRIVWMVLAVLFSIVTLIVYVLFFRQRDEAGS